MQLILDIHEGNKRRSVPVSDTEIGIGRGADNSIVVNDPRSSRRHCVLRTTPQGLLLEDLSSRNGTVLNGAAVSRSILKAGDTFEVGQVRFFLREDGEPSDPSSVLEDDEASGASLDGDGDGDGDGDRDEGGSAAEADDVSQTVAVRALSSDAQTEQTLAAIPGEQRSVWEDKIFLEGVDGPWSGEKVDVRRSPFVIGRSRSCDLTLRDKRASGRHAQILRRGNRFFIEDLGSTNGTAVDRRPVRRARLADGSLIYVGSGSFRFHLPPEIADAVADDEAEAAAVEVDLGSESRRIDVDRLLAERSTGQPWIALVLAAVALVVAYSVWDVTSRAFARRDLDPGERDNLVRNNWSFEDDLREDGSVPGWRLAEAGAGSVRLTDQLAQLPGIRALELTGAAREDALARFVYADELAIETGRRYRLSGFVANTGGAYAAGFVVDWLRQAKDELLLQAQSFSDTVRSTDEAIDVAQEFVAPGGADYARVACFVYGGGTAVFDRVALTLAAEAGTADGAGAAESDDTARNLARELTASVEDAPTLRVRLEPDGTIGMRAASRLDIGSLWSGLDSERDPLLLGPRLAPMRSDLPGSGEVLRVEAVPDVTERSWVTVEKRVVVRRGDIALRVRAALSADAPDGDAPPRLRLYLEPRSASVSLVGHGAMIGALPGDETGGGPYDEIVLGDGEERVSLSFSPAVRARRFAHPAAPWRMVWEFDADGAGEIEMALSTGARFEAEEARGILQTADAAYREGRVGRAIVLLEGVSERFSAQPAMLREARERLDTWRAEAAAGLRVLQSDLAELRKLPARAMYDSLRERTKRFAGRFEGAAEAAVAARMHEELAALWVGLEQSEVRARVDARIERAKGFFANGKLAMAALSLELAAEEAAPEQAREVETLLERVRQRQETEVRILLTR